MLTYLQHNISDDHKDRARCLYTQYVQNINSYELVRGPLSHGCNITTLQFFVSQFCVSKISVF